jgi:hypothetical protein
MVKGRRIQAGASNLSARDQEKTVSTTFFRAPTHKLISPDDYKPTVTAPHVRAVDQMATWGKSTAHTRDYLTTHNQTFQDPSSYPENLHRSRYKTFKEVEEDRIKNADYENAMKKLCALSRKKFGTTSAMLKSVYIYFFID